MRRAAILLAGVLFGAGLVVSGMADPARVLGFLDVTGQATGRWDPTLLAVMGGALLVALPATQLVLRRARPAYADRFHLPQGRRVDTRLVGGSALFGLGWGLTGVCPGPALAGLALGEGRALLFVLAMAAGMLGARFALGLPRPGAEPDAVPDAILPA